MSLKDTLKQAKNLERKLEAGTLSQSIATVKPRNYLALNPLLKKGGIHEKEDVEIVRKKRRRETKQKLRQTDWLSEL
ncbi:hypothetical protein [Psychrobacter pygoscelis]|uniref:hypothetical protein n=1 Tax=Psychrobacter pygoscelis TaxID=2488563 RepID=UPI00103B0672|nr:hypothetical protein [Psychrobacter pygoscelis]